MQMATPCAENPPGVFVPLISTDVEDLQLDSDPDCPDADEHGKVGEREHQAGNAPRFTTDSSRKSK